MPKSVLYRLFRLGRLPKDQAQILRAEDIVLLEEGLSGSITLRNFRAPGRRHSYRKSLFAGSLVVTRLRFAAFSFRRPVINVPLDDTRRGVLEISIPEEGLLSVAFEAKAFNPDHSGSVDIRFHTDSAREFLDHLAAL